MMKRVRNEYFLVSKDTVDKVVCGLMSVHYSCGGLVLKYSTCDPKANSFLVIA